MDLQNANLRTLAFVEAQMTKGLSRPTEYLIPFFQSIISRNAGNPFSVKDAIKNIDEIFGIEVPVYLAESLLPALLESEALVHEQSLGCYICQKTTEHALNNDLNDSHFTILEESLVKFASKHGIEKPLACESWQQALLNFFSEKSSNKKIAKFKETLITNPKERDDWLISKFIFETKSIEPTIFSLIQKIYAGFAIADTITAIQYIGHKDDWNDLTIIYDSTVLMRLLGTSGEFLKKATLEMHNLLLEIGCKTCYFDHNLSELFHNIDALSQKHLSGETMHRETAQALENGEITIGHINLLRGDADTRLGKLNISQIEIPQRLSSVKGQINPVELEEYLKNSINYRNNSYAAQVDAESIEKILFLRADKKYTDLPKSKFIFVTHNTNYAKVSSRYCKEKIGYNITNVPPITTINTLTRMAWLASDHGGGIHLDITKELIINCFEASLPDDKWFNKFWSAIENTAPELLDVNAHDSLYLLDIKKAAEDISLGNSALLDEKEIPQILENAKKAAQELNQKHTAELTEERLKAEQSYQNYLIERENLTNQKNQEIAVIQKITEESISAANEAHQNEKKLLEKNNEELKKALIQTKRDKLETLEEQQNLAISRANRTIEAYKKIIVLSAIAYGFLYVLLIFKLSWDVMEQYTFMAALIPTIIIFCYSIMFEKTLNPLGILKRVRERRIKFEKDQLRINENEIDKIHQELKDLANS